MELQELKKAVMEKWGGIKECSEEIGVSYSSLESVLNGRNPLTKALKHHLMLALGMRKDTLMMFRVSLPDAEVESWVPGWEKLSRAEKAAAAEAVVREAALLAAERGMEGLSEAEKMELARVCGEVIHWPRQMQVPRYAAAAQEPFA